MVRGVNTGNVNVFHNSCTHRGAVVCRQDSGNSKVFQCFYHAWTFDSEGQLKGVPDRDAYAGGVNFDELGLQRVERVESYRGFVFASFDPDIVDLRTYLGDAKDYLDLVIDGCGGSVEMVRGTNEYSFAANWKLLVENSIDGYHAESTHDTYFKYLVSIGTDLRGGVSGRAVDLGNGHAVIEYSSPWGRPVAKWEPLFGEDSRNEIDRLRADLVARHGEQRAHTMAEVNRNLLIYPNLIINDIMAVTVRTFYPPAPDAVDVTAWELAPVNELPSPAPAATRQLPDVPGSGRIRHPRRRRGVGVLPAGLRQRRSRMERHLPRNGSPCRWPTMRNRCAHSGGAGNTRWAPRRTGQVPSDRRRHLQAASRGLPLRRGRLARRVAT